MERNHLEQLLRANGYDATASDDDIKAALLSASYTEEEVAKALATLRTVVENSGDIEKTGNKKLFRSGERLNPSEISQLLGVNVVVKEMIVTEPKKPKFSFPQHMVVWMLSAVLAACAVMGYMYITKMGMFHPAMAHSELTK
ncbi:MAG TPA: hypothetical protein VGE31_02575 [Candidatus Paceibacterota bacterium]